MRHAPTYDADTTQTRKLGGHAPAAGCCHPRCISTHILNHQSPMIVLWMGENILTCWKRFCWASNSDLHIKSHHVNPSSLQGVGGVSCAGEDPGGQDVADQQRVLRCGCRRRLRCQFSQALQGENRKQTMRTDDEKDKGEGMMKVEGPQDEAGSPGSAATSMTAPERCPTWQHARSSQ